MSYFDGSDVGPDCSCPSRCQWVGLGRYLESPVASLVPSVSFVHSDFQQVAQACLSTPAQPGQRRVVQLVEPAFAAGTDDVGQSSAIRGRALVASRLQ